MTNFYLKAAGIWLIALLIMSSCGSDDTPDLLPDDDDVVPGTPRSVTCKINGEGFSATVPFTGGTLSLTGSFYAIAIVGADFFGRDTVSIAIAISGNELSTLNTGDAFSGTGNILEDFAVGEVNVNNRPSVEQEASSSETDNATVTITKIDRDNKLISGTFSYEAVDPDSQTTFSVTEGVFTDIEYD